MKAVALRAALIGLLVASVGYKLQRVDTERPDIRSAVMDLIARKGWPAEQLAGSSPEVIGKIVTFRAEGCGLNGQVYVVDLGFQAVPILDRAIEPDYKRHIAYLGRTWDTPDRVGVRLEWLKQKVLSALGIGDYAVNDVALVIAEPPGCRVADKVDWSGAWRHHGGI